MYGSMFFVDNFWGSSLKWIILEVILGSFLRLGYRMGVFWEYAKISNIFLDMPDIIRRC